MKPIKVFAAILAFVLIAVLAACENSDVPPAGTSQPAQSATNSTPTSESQAVPPETETSSALAEESVPYMFTGETSVEIDGRSFAMEDPPESYAEDVVMRDFLYAITWEDEERAAILPDTEVYAIDIENTKKNRAAGKYIQSYVIHDIFTLTEEQYAQEPATDTDSPSLYYPGWQRTVEEYDLEVFEVIHVTFTQTLSQQANAAGPQWGDGTHDRNFIVGKAASDSAYLVYDFGMMQ